MTDLPFACSSVIRQGNKGLIIAVQSLYIFHSHLGYRGLFRLALFLGQNSFFFLFTNNSYHSTLGGSEQEKDQNERERPHRANFTFDYGPAASFTLNLLLLRNGAIMSCMVSKSKSKLTTSVKWKIKNVENIFNCKTSKQERE